MHTRLLYCNLQIYANEHWYVIVRVHFKYLYHIKMPKGASTARVRGVLIVKKVITCTLCILVSNLFLDR